MLRIFHELQPAYIIMVPNPIESRVSAFSRDHFVISFVSVAQKVTRQTDNY